MKTTRHSILNKLKRYKNVSFDLFDTLVVRCVLNNSDIFKIVDRQVCKNFGFKNKWFLNKRKKANNKLMFKYHRDLTINEIYEQFQKDTNLNLSIIEQIKRIEIETEIKYLEPRLDVQHIFKELISSGINIYIISDTYFTVEIIEKILAKCGYAGYKKILASCQEKARKVTGSMWKKYKKYFGKDWIHIGDNLLADKISPKLKGIKSIRLPSSKSLLNKTLLSKTSNNLNSKIVYGLIYNKILFNSPFKSKIVKSSKDFGYAFLGPFFCHFFTWLNFRAKKTNCYF